jgi:RNA polymerase sigma-70 factor (ECF subfamily)
VADTTVGFQFEYVAGNAPLTVAQAEDRALAEGLCAGEERAYELLILRFEQPVFGLVSRLLDNPADAADVVQEVFLKVFRKVSGFRRESSLKTWIYRIAVNEARNHQRWFIRHRGKEVELEPGLKEQQGVCDRVADPGRNPYEMALDHETEALLESALEKVSPNYRAALILREVEGLSYEEIADILGISLGTVKSRILRGRESLKKRLTERLDSTAPAESSAEFGTHVGAHVRTQQGDAV